MATLTDTLLELEMARKSVEEPRVALTDEQGRVASVEWEIKLQAQHRTRLRHRPQRGQHLHHAFTCQARRWVAQRVGYTGMREQPTYTSAPRKLSLGRR